MVDKFFDYERDIFKLKLLLFPVTHVETRRKRLQNPTTTEQTLYKPYSRAENFFVFLSLRIFIYVCTTKEGMLADHDGYKQHTDYSGGGPYFGSESFFFSNFA